MASFGLQLQPHQLLARPSKFQTLSRNSNAGKLRRFAFRPLAVVDPELRKVLRLASDSELSELSDVLYGKSYFSPLFKSVAPGDGSAVSSSFGHVLYEGSAEERDELLNRLESRLLFLAADAKATVTGRRPRYRDVLLQVRKKLRIPCSKKLCTEDLESEIFLFLLQQHSRCSASERQGSGTRSDTPDWSPISLQVTGLSSQELTTTMLKGWSALALSTLQRFMSKRMYGRMLVETARYRVATESLKKGGQLLATRLESQIAMLRARQFLVGAAWRYTTIRSCMMILGPVLWGTFFAELVLTALGTDYTRVVRAIYALAQIRLTRCYGGGTDYHK